MYGFSIWLVSPFNSKAKLWIRGRKGWSTNYKNLIRENTKPVIWFHCASLGEFEMARPVIEKLSENHSKNYFILISFFSPSGFEIQKNYKYADAVIYLPLDKKSNAKKFVSIFSPAMAVFVKYEIWIHYFNALNQNNSHILLMNSTFRKDQRFFKWYGDIFRKALQKTTKIFVQDELSMELLNSIHVKSEITGDTRYDRVLQIKEQPKSIDDIKEWVNGQFCIVSGSTWPAEESILENIVDKLPPTVKWIIAPHEVSKSHIDKIKNQFKKNGLTYSQLKGVSEVDTSEKNVLIIDSVGILSQIYSLANIAIIGGGFSGKLHNILEPAVYGIPVLFGPKFSKFKEAKQMVDVKAAISFYDDADIILYIEWYYYDHVMVDNVKLVQNIIFEKNRGAVEHVFRYIEENLSKI